jgi:hypothetical protein
MSVTRTRTSCKYLSNSNLRNIGSRDSAVSIATLYGMDDRGSGVPVLVGLKVFTLLCRLDQLWVHSASFPGGKAADA